MAYPGQTSVTLYPLSSYTFGTKPPKFEKDNSVGQRMERLKEMYQREGVRRSVDGVLIVHEHSHPHLLLVQVGSSFFKLPGGRLRPGEDEVEGLMRKLNNLLAPAAATFRPGWRVGECLATYYRPNFENAVYPYCPAHITRPKEIKRIYHVILPDRSLFSIPKNMRLVAVPLFEVYDNPQRYGPIIASIPQLLSRFQFTLVGGRDAGPAAAFGAPAQQPMQQQPSFQQQQHQQPAAGYGGGHQPQQGQQQQHFQQHPQHQAAPGGLAQQRSGGFQGQPMQGMEGLQGGGGSMQYQQQLHMGGGDGFTVDFDDE